MSDEFDNCQDTDFIATLLNYHKILHIFTQNNALTFIGSVFNAQMSMTTDQSQTRNKVFRSFAFFLFSKWQIIRRIITHLSLHLYFFTANRKNFN